MDGEPHKLDHLDRAGRTIGYLVRQPKVAVFSVIGVGVVFSWLVIGAMSVRGAATRLAENAAPGDELMRRLPQFPLPEIVERFFALCLTPAPLLENGMITFGSLTAMWLLMSSAMMLPSAAPLIRTYCEIADTAGKKGEPAVHPLVLVAGYIGVWLAASFGFAGLTMIVYSFSADQPFDPVLGMTGAAALAFAGLYQFSWLKEACLKKCRNPFSTLFSRWSSSPAGVLRLGAEQGMWCLGCCWALMLVMFAVGAMNVFWMALLALFTVVEKLTSGPLVSRVAGAILLVWSAALLLVSH